MHRPCKFSALRQRISTSMFCNSARMICLTSFNDKKSCVMDQWYSQFVLRLDHKWSLPWSWCPRSICNHVPARWAVWTNGLLWCKIVNRWNSNFTARWKSQQSSFCLFTNDNPQFSAYRNALSHWKRNNTMGSVSVFQFLLIVVSAVR